MSSKTTRFEKLLEAVPDALVGMDQKGVIRFVNRQAESLFDYDRDQIIDKFIETLVPDPLWQIYTQNRDEYFTDPRTRSSGLELELIGRQRNGTEFPINVSMSHIDTGDVLLVITAVRDVAKREVAVRNAQLIAAIVESSDDAISGSTLEGIITNWNPAAERMYGYSSKEMIGRSAGLLTPGDRAGEMKAVLARIRQGEAVVHLETTLARKDGTVFPVSFTVSPIRDEDGTVVGACAVHRDVTEQRQAFEAAQRLAAIVKHSNDAIVGRTLDGIITSWNRAAERMFGYSSTEMIGRSADLLTPEDRRSEVKDFVAGIRTGQHLENLETIRLRKDGTEFPVSLTISPICDTDGVVVGVSMIGRDLTEQQHAAHYARSLIEAGLDPMMTISSEGKISDVNEATVNITGVPREALIGTDFSRYFTEPDQAAEAYHTVLAQGPATDYPLTVRHRDGTLTDVLCNASVYRDLAGNVLGVLATGRDVTRAKQAFEASQRIAAIVECSNDAIFGCTLDGIITSWNPAAERMYGYSSAEVIGMHAKTMTPKDRADEMKAILGQIKAGRAVQHFETLRVRKDGTMVPVSLAVSPIRDSHGVVIGTSVIHRDLTEVRHAAG